MIRRSRRRASPLRVAFLVALILVALYFNQVVVPAMPSPFVPTPTPTRSSESLVNEAESLFQDGKLTQSVAAYKQAILADPRNPANYVAMSRIQMFAGLYEDAQKSAEDALLLNPNNPTAHALKGWALDFQGDYLEAEAAVKKALELDPNHAQAYAYYAEILLDRGLFEDLAQAIEYSRKAQELAPNLLETHRIRGYVFYATGNPEEAIQAYKAALAINDKIWGLHYSLGVVYKISGAYDQAVQELLAAIALNPNNPDIPTEISRTYAAIGQYGKAVQYAEQALKVDPSNPRLHGNLGVMLYRDANDYDRAISEIALAVHGGTTVDGAVVQGLPLSPGRVADDYYSIYGLALVKRNRCPEAVPIFQLILQNISEDQIASYNAREGISYCQETFGTPPPEADETATSDP